MKNTSAVEKIQGEIADIAERGGKFNLKEIDDLISNVTDSMPDGLLKSRTAQQVAAELSDSLSTLVKRRAKQFPELNKAWKAAWEEAAKNAYTIQSILRQYSAPISIGIVVICCFVGFAVLWTKLSSVCA